MMNVLIVSTVGHNPGDDFIRLGQEHLLGRVISQPEFTVVHKHDPRTLYPDAPSNRTPHRLLAPLLYRLHTAHTHASNRLSDADLVLFAGTPFIWRQNTWLLPSTSANAEWVRPIWGTLIGALPATPVMNLAAGTSLNSLQDIDAILSDSRLVAFLRSALRRSILTTARDATTARILTSLGFPVPLLPCTSLWAAAGARLRASTPEYVALNVMRRGVHPARGKETATRAWKDVISVVVQWLAERHPLRFICHSPDELALAREWFPEHPTLHSRDPITVLTAYGRALYTVSNRVHGAAGAASFGRPALGVGGDSRMQLLTEFGLPTLDAATASADDVIAACERMELSYDEISRDLAGLSVREGTRYVKLLQGALQSISSN